MNEVTKTEVLESARDLYEKVPSQDFIKAKAGGIGVLAENITCFGECSKLIALLHEMGEVGQLAILHDEVNMGICLDAGEESDDVRVLQALENTDLGLEVLLELSGELLLLDSFDSGERSFGLIMLVLYITSGRTGHALWEAM